MQELSESEIEAAIRTLEKTKLPKAKKEYDLALEQFLDAGGFVPARVQNRLTDAHEKYIRLQDSLNEYKTLLSDINRYCQ